MMPNRLYVLSLVLSLAAGVSACATTKCLPEYCASDAKITDEVRTLFAQHPEFGPPGTLRVQTINGTVYLNGQVDTGMVRQDAESLVRQVPNVVDVMNSLYTSAVQH